LKIYIPEEDLSTGFGVLGVGIEAERADIGRIIIIENSLVIFIDIPPSP